MLGTLCDEEYICSGDGVFVPGYAAPSTEDEYDVLEPFDPLATDDALNESTRGDEPTDEMLAWL